MSFLSLALLAAGILLLDEPGQGRSAGMLMGSSALLTAGWLDNWHVGPLPLISVPASPLGIVLASWAMFCYPNSPGEQRAGRRFFTVIFAWLLIGRAGLHPHLAPPVVRLRGRRLVAEPAAGPGRWPWPSPRSPPRAGSASRSSFTC